MNQTAIHLARSVFPQVAARQWVLTFPFPIRFLLASDPSLISPVLACCLRVIQRWNSRGTRRAKLDRKSVIRAQGAVTFIQRFGSALNLNIHFHAIVTDGVFVQQNGNGACRFYPAPEPSTEDVEALLSVISCRVNRLLQNRGLIDPQNYLEEAEQLGGLHSGPTLLRIQSASILNQSAMGSKRGQKITKIGATRTSRDAWIHRIFEAPQRCASIHGFGLHANTLIKAHRRDKLEKLLRYAARPPLALERLCEITPGKLSYRLKTPFYDGTTHIMFEPTELIERLVGLIPPPRNNLHRYHGVFAPNHPLRSQVVPNPQTQGRNQTDRPPQSKRKLSRSFRLTWAELQQHCFGVDLTQCDRCGGKISTISIVMKKDAIEKILRHFRLPYKPPTVHAPRGPPKVAQLQLGVDHGHEIQIDDPQFEEPSSDLFMYSQLNPMENHEAH